MSIWDNVKKFAQPYSDDEYDDYDDYDNDFEEEVEDEPVRRAPRKNTRPARAPRRMPALDREPARAAEEEYEDDYESAFQSVPKAAPAPAPVAAPAPAAAAPASFPGKVVSMNRGGAAQEIVRFHPTSFQDSKKAAKDLVSSKAVIVNLEDLDKDSSRRMVDFLSGVVFAMDGDVQKIAKAAYVFCPPNVFITGGPEEVQTVAEELV